MKKFTTVAVIAALALATQAFAMGGSSRGGQSKPASMPTMTSGTHSMATTTPMSGAATMTSTMTSTMAATGPTRSQMTPVSAMKPAAAK